MSSFLQRVVKNDAMREDPPEIYGWRVYALACSACFGGLIFGIDTGVIGGVLRMPEFQELYQLTDRHVTALDRANLSANIVSTLQAGCFIGALLAAQAADRWGRRPVLIWAAGGISVIGVVLQAAASGHLAPMYIGRFVSGFGTGFASMVNPLYIAENAPRAIRGGLTGIYQLFIVFGIFIAYWINYGCLLHVTGTARYMIPLVIQGVPPALIMISMYLCNESPRHLAKQDRWEEAQEVLVRIRGLPIDHPYVAKEFADIRHAIESENALLDGAGWRGLMKEMWTIPANRKRALISITLMFFQQMTGTNAINYYAPRIFASLGVTGANNELFATGIYGLIKLIAVLIFLIFVADSLGRRRSLLWTGIGMGATMLYIGEKCTPLHFPSRKQPQRRLTTSLSKQQSSSPWPARPKAAARPAARAGWRSSACSCSRPCSSSAGAPCAGSTCPRSRRRGCAPPTCPSPPRRSGFSTLSSAAPSRPCWRSWAREATAHTSSFRPGAS
ncbi:hypothetical protein RB595_008938 [Gaeumannomyces hyphopodioides]